MPSLISYVIRFAMRRAAIFGKPGASIQEQRARMEKTTSLLPAPAWLTVTPVQAGGVLAEWDCPAGCSAGSGIILYIHGGSWSLGSPRTHRSLLARLARAAGMKALSIDYRLAPEHPFPAALDDCLIVYRWLRAQSEENIIVAGDSSGGNLVLAALLALRDMGEARPSAAVCLSPAADLVHISQSMNTGFGSIIQRYAGQHDLRDPLISPIYGDLNGLPPVLIHVGEQELLHADAARFVERACAAGVDARLVVWPGMSHVFQMYAPILPEANASIRQMGEFMRAMAR